MLAKQAQANKIKASREIGGAFFHADKYVDGRGLIIYSQENGTGMLSVSEVSLYNAGIGGGLSESSGEITINGGTITVAGGEFGAGIGSGRYGDGGKITINGGTITVAGGKWGAGIGGGLSGTGGKITINNGTVTATGGYQAAGIGGGHNRSEATLVFGRYPVVKAGDNKDIATDVDIDTYKTDYQNFPYVYLRFAKAEYQVKHLLQKELFGEEYELKDTETLIGGVNSLTEAVAKSYDGYEPSFDQQKIKEDGTTVVEIKYNIIYNTISFDANGYGTAPDPIHAVSGTEITAPQDPSVEGYTFGGWYTEKECTNKFTFSTMPSEDMTLYAKWTINQYTITWKDGGNVLKTEEVDYDTMPDYGDNPVKQGYVFVSWYPTVQKVTGDATYNAVFFAPSDPDVTKGDDNDVTTGDDNNALPYGIAMILALAGIGIAAKMRKED